MVFESSNTKLIFDIWKFKNTQKTKQKTKTHSCFGIQRNKNPKKKINNNNNNNCRVGGPNYLLGLGLWLKILVVRGEINSYKWYRLKNIINKKWVRMVRWVISSSDMANLIQIYTSLITITFQEAPMIEMCLTNIREGRKHKNI